MSLLGAGYSALARPALFRLDAERAHELGATVLSAMHRSPAIARMLGARVAAAPATPISAMGLRFPNPLGVAAGFDKAGRLYNGLGALGFGFVEVGTVTARAQPGNPRPRLFRLPEDQALLNRMGFNNPGAAAVAEALAAHPPRGIVLGVNIGKSKVTPIEDAAADYAESARLLGPLADYLVINVSSPNTPGLRSLQSVAALGPIVDAVQHELAALHKTTPLLVKIAPDLADEDIDAVADLAMARRLAGLVATNTTIARPDTLRTPRDEVQRLGDGGLSGAPLRERAKHVVRRLRERLGQGPVLVGAGGISSGEDVVSMCAMGATLVQLYSAFIFGGPDLPSRILEEYARSGEEAMRRRPG